MKRGGWNLLSKHGQALVSISRRPDIRMTDLAQELGMTERAIRMLVTALKTSEALRVVRRGRNNRYEVDLDFALSHPVENGVSLRQFLALYGMTDGVSQETDGEGSEARVSLHDGVGISPDAGEKAVS